MSRNVDFITCFQYQEHGSSFIPQISGDFAFVIYDNNTGEFIAARDPVGVVPLYQGKGKDGSLWFSSELKCLTESCLSIEPFPPGHMYSSKSGKLEKYFQPTWSATKVPTQKRDLMALRYAFEESVRKRLMSDVPFGCLLSGGVDSRCVLWT